MTKTPLGSLPALIIGWLVTEIKRFAQIDIHKYCRTDELPIRQCPYCGGRELRRHQLRDRAYQVKPRDQYPGGKRPRAKALRIACDSCGRTTTVLPSFLSQRRLYVVRRRQVAVLEVAEAGQSIEAASRALGYVGRGLVRRWVREYHAQLDGVRARLQQVVAQRADEATVRCSGDTPALLRCWTAGLIRVYEPYAEDRWWEQLNYLLSQDVAQGRRPGGWLRTL